VLGQEEEPLGLGDELVDGVAGPRVVQHVLEKGFSVMLSLFGA